MPLQPTGRVPIDAAAQRGPGLHLVLQRLDTQASPGAFAPLGAGPVVLATLFDPQAVAPLDARALAAMFGFTPAEARVAVCMAQGRSAPEIAAMLVVAPSTVRSHLGQVVAKLGVARKPDAVRMLAQSGWMWRADLPRGHGHA